MHMTWKQLCVHIFDIVTVIDLISSLVFILMFPKHFFFFFFFKGKKLPYIKACLSAQTCSCFSANKQPFETSFKVNEGILEMNKHNSTL